jgi:hypothetical protein
MKSFSIGLVILSAFLMVGSVPPKPREEYDEGLRSLQKAMESCSIDGAIYKLEIKMFCAQYPTSSRFCDQYLNNVRFPNPKYPNSADDCRKKYDAMYDKCCKGLEWSRDDYVVKLLGVRECIGTKSDIKTLFCEKYPTSSSACPGDEYLDKEGNCRKAYDYMYGKCCSSGLEWWVILLIFMAVVEVIGVIIGIVACRRGKANPNYAAGANGSPGNVVGQTGNAYGQTQPVGALQHVYFEFNSTSGTLIHLLHNYFFSFSMN